MLKTYTVIKPKLTQKQKTIYWMVGIALAMALVVFLFRHIPIVFLLAIIIGTLCFGIADKMSKTREEPYEYLNKELIFDIDTITIGGEIFSVDQLKKLTLQLFNYDGETLGSREDRISNGTDNYLSFAVGTTVYEYVFYIDSKEQYNAFQDLFESWYKKGINLIELDGGDKRIFLGKELDYLEKLRFAEKYNIQLYL